LKRDYELTFILRIESNEEALNGQIDEVKGWVEAEELGTVNRIDRWGRRRLAYEIDRQREGIYVLMDSTLDSAGLDELERNLRLAPNVLRYLIVRKDE
jgi:small subunit ribosomal protein S6